MTYIWTQYLTWQRFASVTLLIKLKELGKSKTSKTGNLSKSLKTKEIHKS